jgi:hypothetical protein
MSPRTLIGWRTLVVVLVFVALEGALAAFTGYGKWVTTEKDAELGWRPIPDQTGWSWDLSVAEHINSRGYRDDEWTPARDDDGVFRIALLGNSMTYGSGVAIEDTWGRELERLVQAEFDRSGIDLRVESMNFAVQGYVFEQMARTYEREVRPFRPDLVLVGTVPFDASPFDGASGEQDVPYRRTIAKTASHDFLLKEAMLPLKGRLRLGWSKDAVAAEKARVDTLLRERPYSSDAEYLWDAMRARMEDIEAQVEADGGRLVVVALPQFSNLVRESAKTHAEIWTPWAASRGETAGVPNALAIDSRPAFEKAMPKLLAGMRKLGFKDARTFVEDSGYWIVTPSIAHQDENLFLDDDMGHYGERGHRVLAKDVFDELKRSGWLEVLARN